MLRLESIAILTFLAVVWAGDPCPPKEELGTCTCKQATLAQSYHPSTNVSGTPQRNVEDSNSMRTIVTCNATESILALEEIVTQALHRKEVDLLVLSHVPPQKDNTLVRLPREWLKYVRVKIFEIQDTPLSGDFIRFNYPFEGQEPSLLWFIAKRCCLYGSLTGESANTVNTRGLELLWNLEGVDLSHNHLTYVDNYAFRYLPFNATFVNLSHNSLRAMADKCFEQNYKLKYIDLSHNLLEVMYRTMFNASTNLEYIDLSYNLFKSLPADFFQTMVSLKTVILKKNFLYSMPEYPWTYVFKTPTSVDVTGNFIHCDCNLLWLLPMVSSSGKTLKQRIQGSCSQDILKNVDAILYDLASLTKNQLLC